MNIKKWLVASIVVFVALAIMEYLLHGVILASAYMAKPEYWLPEATMKARIWALYLGYLVYSGVFTLIYSKGYEGKSWFGEGFRYGLYIGFLTAIPRFFIEYAVMPYPANLTVSWLIAGLVVSVILGVIVGALYRTPAPKPAA
jgi:hypothetical protein